VQGKGKEARDEIASEVGWERLVGGSRRGRRLEGRAREHNQEKERAVGSTARGGGYEGREPERSRGGAWAVCGRALSGRPDDDNVRGRGGGGQVA